MNSYTRFFKDDFQSNWIRYTGINLSVGLRKSYSLIDMMHENLLSSYNLSNFPELIENFIDFNF